MSIMATYRAAVLIVAAEMIKTTTARHRGIVTWKKRSPVLSACQAFMKVVITPRTYGGVVNSSVMTFEYWRVPTTVGKKLVTDAAETLPNSMTS